MIKHLSIITTRNENCEFFENCVTSMIEKKKRKGKEKSKIVLPKNSIPIPEKKMKKGSKLAVSTK